MRLDLYLKRCRILRRRSEAKQACDNGIVTVDARPGKPGREVRAGQQISIGFLDRDLEIRVVEIPRGNISKKDAPRYYEVIRDEPRDPMDF